MKTFLVSIIITTKNEAVRLPALLESIKNQTYTNIETIIVDNNSVDQTKAVAKQFGIQAFDKGPERSAQRNFGAWKAKGTHLLFLDADMEVSKKVVEECVSLVKKDSAFVGVVIPEQSFGIGFWAQCKVLERSFYLNVPWIESPRFYQRKAFLDVGGFDETLTGPEDFELSQRFKQVFGDKSIGRISAFLLHNEGKLSLVKTLKKKMYYGKKMNQYRQLKSAKGYFDKQSSVFERYKLFFSKKRIILRNPIVFMGMVVLKTLEMGALALGKIFF